MIPKVCTECGAEAASCPECIAADEALMRDLDIEASELEDDYAQEDDVA